MPDIAAIALQDTMTGTMIAIGGETIGTAGIEIEIEIETGMDDTVRAVEGTRPVVRKAEEGQHKEYNPQGHQDHIVRKEARAEDGQDRRMRRHNQRIAIGMHCGPCLELWTRTVSDVCTIANMPDEEHAC